MILVTLTEEYPMSQTTHHANQDRKNAAGHASDACHALPEREILRLAAIIQYSNDAILSMDFTGVVESWNPAATVIYGYDAGEVIGKNVSILVPPGYSDEVVGILDRVSRGERVEHFKTKRMRKDGRLIDIFLTVSPIMDADGGISSASSIARDITEQERASEELRKWAQFFQRAEWGVVVGSTDSGTLEVMNPAFARMHGYSVDELTGRPIVEVIAPEMRAELPEQIRIAYRLGHYTFESRHIRKDGTIFPVLVNVTAVRDEDGRLLHQIVTVLDITERKKVEDALRKSEDSLREAQKIAGIGNWDWNMRTGELLWSDEIYRIFGIKPRQFQAAYGNFLNTVHPGDRDFVEQAVDKAIKERAPYDINHRIVHPDGSVRVVNEQGRVFLGEDGQPVRMVGTVHDITEEIENRREMQKLAMALEQASDWILVTDLKGRIEYVNKAVTAMSGFEKTDLMGKTPAIFKSGKHDESFYRELWQTIQSGHPYQAIITNKRKDGRLFEIYHSITPLKNESGEITHFITTSKDVSQQKLLEDRLHYLANYDALTDLPNRMLFLDRLHQSLGRAEHNRRQVAVVCIDIGRFSLINDSYGYEVGDVVLKETAERLSGLIRDGDTASRFGADEFGLILADMAHSDDVLRIIDHIISELQKPIGKDGIELILTLSAGISLFPHDGHDETTLLRNADIALSRARGTGGNSYLFFQAEMNTHASEFVLLERHLHQALKNREFLLHYQPYFDARTGKIAGMEALLRWQSENLGLVMPSRFIPILEDTGMIVEVGQWVFRSVCRQIGEWQHQGLAVVPVAFNLSVVQFRRIDLVDTMEEEIRASAVDPRCLTLEITESTFMNDLAYTDLILERLKKLGMRIAIDDFGTGYSSLSYLKRLPLDILKIDISFVRDIASNPDDEAIAAVIISLAKSLNLKTLAEGVETEAQLNVLQRLGCDLIQGFFFCRPMPGREVEDFLKRGAPDGAGTG